MTNVDYRSSDHLAPLQQHRAVLFALQHCPTLNNSDSRSLDSLPTADRFHRCSRVRSTCRHRSPSVPKLDAWRPSRRSLKEEDFFFFEASRDSRAPIACVVTTSCGADICGPCRRSRERQLGPWNRPTCPNGQGPTCPRILVAPQVRKSIWGQSRNATSYRTELTLPHQKTAYASSRRRAIRAAACARQAHPML